MKSPRLVRRIKTPWWLLIVASIAAYSATNHANDTTDEWDLFEHSRQHSIGLRVGDSDSLSWGADVELMLPLNTELSADYLQSEFSLVSGDEQLSSYAVQFSSDPLARWSAQLIYEHTGERDSLETEDFGLGVQYRAERWQLGLRYLIGEVDLRTAPIAVRLQPRDYNLDREAYEAEFAALGEHWQWSVRYLDYRYERSISLNPVSLALLRRLGFNTFQQVFGLVNWSASTELGYYQNQHSWRLGYSQYALELTDETGRIPYAAWDYAFTDRLSAGLMGAAGLDDSEHYVELSLRIGF